MPEKIWMLTGEIQSGKTSSLLEWSQGRNEVHGILTPVVNGKRVFMDAHTREQFPMEAEGDEEFLPVGRFRFSKKYFDKAISILESHVNLNGWLLIDEIGPLELKGEGFAEVTKRIIKQHPGNVLFVVRKQLLQEVIHHFELQDFSPQVVSSAREL